MKKTLTVEGMMCAHCEAHVKKALAAVEGVAEVTVDLQSKKATVTLTKDVSDKSLMDAVAEAGYTPVDCIAKQLKIEIAQAAVAFQRDGAACRTY